MGGVLAVARVSYHNQDSVWGWGWLLIYWGVVGC